jgi:hypothetical protein
MLNSQQDAAIQDLNPGDLLSSLRDTIMPEDGTVSLTYDRTIRKPLRLRATDGTKLDDFTHTRAAAVLHTLSASMAPIDLQYLRARFSYGDPDGTSYALFQSAIQSIPRVFTWAANERRELDGIPLQVRAGLTRPTGAAPGDFEADFQAGAQQADLAAGAQHQALHTFAKQGLTLWRSIVANVVGPWALDSGVTDMRFSGSITADGRGPRPQAPVRMPTVH